MTLNQAQSTSFARDPMANLAIKVVIAVLVVPTIVAALMGWW